MRELWSAIERKLHGHVNIGPVTIYGANAMHWAVNISTRRWGYICFRLPLPCFGVWWGLYFYVSPNGTPWAATYHWQSRSALRRYGPANNHTSPRGREP